MKRSGHQNKTSFIFAVEYFYTYPLFVLLLSVINLTWISFMYKIDDTI